MATITGEQIIARARVTASQMGGDANVSPVIDNKGGLRALLNNAIRQVYRARSNDQKFIRDTVTKHTVTVTGGTGACPDGVMRELLHQAQFQDPNGALITYFNYNIDQDGETYDQLGYVCMDGSNFKYKAPSPDFSNYSGSLYVTVATFPTFPADLSNSITFPSTTIIDDVVLTLGLAIIGKVQFE